MIKSTFRSNNVLVAFSCSCHRTAVGDRGVQIDVPPATQREFAREVFVPVEGSVPAAFVDYRPTVRQAQLGNFVATIADELEILSVRYQSRTDLVRMQ
jgi:hypothetical protein